MLTLKLLMQMIRFDCTIFIHIQTTKTVVTRHVFWTQNIPKMHLRIGLRPRPSAAYSGPSEPLARPKTGLTFGQSFEPLILL